jgi:hypothetical protein
MNKLLLSTAFLASFVVPAAAGILGMEVLDNGSVIDTISGITTGTANLVTSDPNFSNIVISVQGSPTLPNADLSTVTIDAASRSTFTGTHVLGIDVFQTDIIGNGPTRSTFTVNGLVGDPGPTTESTFEGGTATTLGTLLASHTFPASDEGAFGPIVAGSGPFTADATSYGITFTAAGQSFGGSTELTTNVPEPSTWAMLAIGFAFLGWTAFHRRPRLDLGT